jgi:hypothetical protein
MRAFTCVHVYVEEQEKPSATSQVFETLSTRSKYFTETPGVDIMITIFCNFRQFLAKKVAFFSKTNVMIKSLHNLALF